MASALYLLNNSFNFASFDADTADGGASTGENAGGVATAENSGFVLPCFACLALDSAAADSVSGDFTMVVTVAGAGAGWPAFSCALSSAIFWRNASRWRANCSPVAGGSAVVGGGVVSTAAGAGVTVGVGSCTTGWGLGAGVVIFSVPGDLGMGVFAADSCAFSSAIFSRSASRACACDRLSGLAKEIEPAQHATPQAARKVFEIFMVFLYVKFAPDATGFPDALAGNATSRRQTPGSG
jgi:hypothetical protein